jgi:hypothetical protein
MPGGAIISVSERIGHKLGSEITPLTLMKPTSQSQPGLCKPCQRQYPQEQHSPSLLAEVEVEVEVEVEETVHRILLHVAVVEDGTMIRIVPMLAEDEAEARLKEIRLQDLHQTSLLINLSHQSVLVLSVGTCTGISIVHL